MTDVETVRTRLRDRVARPCDITAEQRDRMFALFCRYYANITRASFEADLAVKSFAILLEDEGEVVGFTTAEVTDFAFEDHAAKIVFSGDTIVAQEHWGEQVLAQAWLREIGRWGRTHPTDTFYWFLIVKGHRTYRYLPAFALRYVPSDEANDADSGGLFRLRNALAVDRFGSDFDPVRGIVSFAAARGHLQPDWAEPSQREERLPAVNYFLNANPRYREGDELACLCSLERTNMRPLARRWFDVGWNAA